MRLLRGRGGRDYLLGHSDASSARLHLWRYANELPARAVKASCRHDGPL
jgi:hypothetical protein